MSVADLKKLGQLCAEDEEVKAKVKELVTDEDDLIAYAAEHGLEITHGDLESLAEEVKSSGQLTEEQLEQVAGGVIAIVAGAGIMVVASVTCATGQ